MRFENLHYVAITDRGKTKVLPYIRLGTLNSRSVKNKDPLIIGELEDKNVDIVLITKTWIKNTDEDSAWLNQSDLTQGNFSVTMHNRPGNKKGGGIALMYRSQYNIRLLETDNTNIMQYGY